MISAIHSPTIYLLLGPVLACQHYLPVAPVLKVDRILTALERPR